jgi:hypothetical protein
MQLDPLLLEASFLAAPPDNGEFAEMEEIEPPFYLLSIYRDENGMKILKRKLWIDRRDLRVEKELLFSGQGIPEIEFIRKNYSGDRYFAFPQVIEFSKLTKNEKVKLEFVEKNLNLEVSYQKFQYQPPQGAVIETVN